MEGEGEGEGERDLTASDGFTEETPQRPGKEGTGDLCIPEVSMAWDEMGMGMGQNGGRCRRTNTNTMAPASSEGNLKVRQAGGRWTPQPQIRNCTRQER